MCNNNTNNDLRGFILHTVLIQNISLCVSIYWDYALTVPLRQIVCIHCHQRSECCATF